MNCDCEVIIVVVMMDHSCICIKEDCTSTAHMTRNEEVDELSVTRMTSHDESMYICINDV